MQRALLALVGSAALAVVLSGAGNGAGVRPLVFAADQAPAFTNEVYRLPLGGHAVDLSRSPFDDLDPQVSPDGRWVAFVSNRGGVTKLYLVRPDGSGLHASTPLPKGGGSASLAWSPDSRHLAIVLSDIQSVLLLAGPGEAARTIARADSLFTPAWSPDGKVLTVLSRGAVDAYTVDGTHAWNRSSGFPVPGWSRGGIFAAGAIDGKLTTYDSAGNRVFTTRADVGAWSPDGAHLAVFAGRQLRVLTTTGRVVFTLPKGLDGSLLQWASNDEVVAGAAQTGKPMTVSIRTKKVRPLDAVPYVIAHSTDGKLTATLARRGSAFAVRVAGSLAGTVPGCWDDGSITPAVMNLQFTPDDRSLVYQSSCGEPWSNLWSASADGGSQRRLTTAAAEQTEPALSPDGSELAYSQSPHAGLSCKGCPQLLYVAAADGSHAKALTSGTYGSFDSDASWSPDGAHILFRHSTFDSTDLWEIPATGGSPTDLHISGESPAWGPSRIAYVNGSVTPIALMTAAPDGTDRTRVASGLVTAPAWSHDGRLAWLRTTANGDRWWLFEQTGSGTKQFVLPFTAVRDLAWSPGGSRFAVAAKSKTSATFDVYTMSLTGTDIHRVTRNVNALDVGWG